MHPITETAARLAAESVALAFEAAQVGDYRRAQVFASTADYWTALAFRTRGDGIATVTR